MTAAETLARLPQDAAVVGWVRLASADQLVDWATRAPDLRAELKNATGHESVASLLGALGLEPGAPIAFGVVSPDRAAAERLLDAVSSAKNYDEVMQAVETAPANGGFVRLVARLRGRVDVTTLWETGQTGRGPTVHRCDEGCISGFEDATAIIAGDGWVAALYPDGQEFLEVDVVFVDDLVPFPTRVLRELRKGVRGAPQGRCSALNPEADLSLCVDAERAAELGASTGMLVTLRAIGGRSIDDWKRAQIGAQGKKESLRNLKPERNLLDDGTLHVTLAARGFEIRGSWAFTDNTRAAPSKLEPELCAAPADLVRSLVPDIVGRLGDGASLKDPKARRGRLHEPPPWVGGLVLLGRTWRHFLGGLKDGTFAIGRVPVSKVCRAASADRLALRVEGPAVPFLDELLADHTVQ